MASKEDLSEQLALTSKLAAQVERMAQAVERANAAYESQIDAVQKLANVFGQINTQGSVQNVEILKKTVDDAASNIEKAGKTTEQTFQHLGKKIDDFGKTISQKFPKSVLIGTAALSGLKQGIRNVIALGKGFGSFVTGIVDGLANIAASIIAIPLHMFEELVDIVGSASGGSNELARALEDLRKQFGEFYGPTNKAIISTTKELKGFSDTGLNAWFVFGNMAERLKYIGEIAKEMGAQFNKFTKEFEDNGGALLAYQKGLGLSGEEMKSVGVMATATGQKLSNVLKDFTKFSRSLADAGADAKLLSRDMGKMAGDVKHFGQLGAKELSEVALYARKLGIEVDKMTATLDKFESFDQSAEAAAQLAQAFGANIDAFKIMESQNPAEQFDMLRKAMFAVGKSAENMNRQELKLLAQQTGMDEQTAKLAFSMKNQGMSLDEIKKKSSDAEKKTLTQAQAMQKLADAIERLVYDMGAMKGGFWAQFLDGILRGLQSMPEFIGLIFNIKIALREALQIGVQLGRVLPNLIPGLKDIIGGLKDFFDPKHFRKFFHGISDAIKDFFDKDGHDKDNVPRLFEKLKKTVKDFFSDQGANGKRILEGFKKLFKMLAHVAAEGIKYMADKLAEGVKFIIDLLTGKEELNIGGLGGAAEGGLGFLKEILVPLGQALKHAWNVLKDPLRELIKTLGKMLFDFLTSEEFIKFVKPALPILGTVLFGPAVGRALLATLASSLMKGAGNLMVTTGKKILGRLVGKAEAVVENAKKVPGKEGIESIEKVGAVNKASQEAIKSGKGWGVKDAAALGLKLVAIATALSIGGVKMSLAIIIMKKILDIGGVKSLKDAEAPLAVLVGMTLAAIPLIFAMKLANKAGSFKDVLVGGLIISAAVGIVGIVGAGLAYVLKKVASPDELKAAGDIMLKMSLVFLAMVPLIFASMAIGALASGPQALALAAAAVGLGVIGGAVGEMAGIAMKIVDQLSDMKIDSSFQTKIDAFLGIMKAIQAFADSLVKVIEMMQPSLIGLLTGTEEKFTVKIAAATDLINTMVGQAGQPGGIVGMMNAVEGIVTRLGEGGQKMAAGAQVFSAVMEAVSSALKALIPPDSFFEAGSSFINRLFDPTYNFSSLTADIQNYAYKMQAQLMQMLGEPGEKGTGILGLIDKLSNIKLPNPDKAEKVANIVSSIANITKAVTPDPKTLELMQSSGIDASYAWGLLKFDNKKEGIKADDIAKLMKERVDNVKGIIDAITKGPVAAILNVDVPKEKIDGLKVIGDILQVVVNLAKAINDAIPKGNITIPPGANNIVMNLVPSVSSVLDGMKDNLSKLVASLIDVVNKLPDDKKFMKNLETAKTLFGFIGEIPKLADSLKNLGGDVKNVNPLMDAVDAARTFLGRLITDYGVSPLGLLIDNMITVDNMLRRATGINIDKIGSNIENIMAVVDRIGKKFPTMMQSVNSAINAIPQDGLKPAVEAVGKMIQAANDLNSALARGDLNNIDVKAKLEKVAEAVGLGGKASYTINPSKEVVITVNMTVTMDAGTVEKVILQREGSIIRDRLNFATSYPNEKATSEIPSNVNAVTPIPVRGGTKT